MSRRSASYLFTAIVFIGAAVFYGPMLSTQKREAYWPDNVEIRQLADSIAQGRGFQESRFPQGYPLVVAAMAKLGIGGDRWLIALNLVAMWVGFSVFALLFRKELKFSPIASQVAAYLPLVFWGFVLYAPIVPEPEMMFIAVSACALLCICRISDGWIHLTFAVLLTAAAIAIRTIGIALVFPLLWAIAREPSIRKWLIRPGSLVVLAVIAVAGAWRIARTTYFSQLLAWMNDDTISGGVQTLVGWRLNELAEIGLLTHRYSVPWPLRYDFPLAGLVLLSFSAVGVWTVRKSSLAIYLGLYVAILAVWPFPGIRFWLPVIPLIYAFGGLGMVRLARALVTRWSPKPAAVQSDACRPAPAELRTSAPPDAPTAA